MVRVTVDIDDELYLRLLRVALKKYKRKRGAIGLVLNEAIRLYLSEVEGEEGKY
jgi:metal-responsive CopG/Arc/MetJ family transcriptional regulator